MDFSSLVKAVQDFWNFIWPPVLCTLALIGIAYFEAPNWCRRVRGFLIAKKPSPESQIAFAKLSKRFGLDKLAPIVIAFTLLFVLSATRNVVLLLGSLVPIEVTNTPDLWIQSHSQDPRLADLWLSYGTNGNASALHQQIQRSVDEAKQKDANGSVISSFQYWKNIAGSDTEMFNACKFLVLWSILMLLLELRERRQPTRALGRCFVLVTVLLFAAACYVVLDIYALDQQQYAALDVAEVYKSPEAHNCETNSDPQCEMYRKVMEAPSSYPADGRWWHIRFAPGWVLRWVFDGLR